MMPLSMSQSGVPLCIERINGKDETKSFLENLGFLVGGQIMIISQISGNMIINVKGSRVAISKSMANRIMVS